MVPRRSPPAAMRWGDWIGGAIRRSIPSRGACQVRSSVGWVGLSRSSSARSNSGTARSSDSSASGRLTCGNLSRSREVDRGLDDPLAGQGPTSRCTGTGARRVAERQLLLMPASSSVAAADPA